MTQPTLVIRADANTRIGMGHLMRCLSLGEEWIKRGGQIVLVTSDMPFDMQAKLISRGISVYATNPGVSYDVIEIAKAKNAEWVVIDGYGFGVEHQMDIKAAGLSLLVIDDFGKLRDYYADIILNQNIYAPRLEYKNHKSYTRILRGLKYVLLRDEFAVKKKREVPEFAQNILVTFGGGDPENITLKVIELLKHIKGITVTILVGSSNPHRTSLEQCIAGHSALSLVNNSDHVSEHMRVADVTISASGTTCYELISTRCPSIIVPVADNQILISETMQARGLAKVVNVNELNETIIEDFIRSQEERQRCVNAMEGLIDNRGAARVVNIMTMKLRKPKLSDCHTVWEWVNEEEYRAHSFEQKRIPLDLHKTWFTNAVNDEKVVYYIATMNGNMIGQARFHRDIKKGSAIISVLVAKEYRGQLLGSWLIQRTTEEFFAETTDDIAHAYVRPENIVSQKAFLDAGYISCGDTKEHFGITTKHYVKPRDESW